MENSYFPWFMSLEFMVHAKKDVQCTSSLSKVDVHYDYYTVYNLPPIQQHDQPHEGAVAPTLEHYEAPHIPIPPADSREPKQDTPGSRPGPSDLAPEPHVQAKDDSAPSDGAEQDQPLEQPPDPPNVSTLEHNEPPHAPSLAGAVSYDVKPAGPPRRKHQSVPSGPGQKLVSFFRQKRDSAYARLSHVCR